MPVFALLLLLAAGPDSSRLDARARNAQAQFESARMLLLRTGEAGGSGCDARIGRFCYSYSGESGGDLPKEPQTVAKERLKLLAVLDSTARALPGDGWVAGQRVRYWIEAGQSDSATGAARECRAEAWWCAALLGLSRHAAGDFAAAEQAYHVALDSMAEDQRCRWTDLSDLLDDPLRARYRALPCAGRDTLADRVWWLAQPLWSLSGNDRRTEHYARHTMARLLADSRWALADWGSDARELIVRYGWPLAFESDDCGGMCRPVPLGYLQEPSFHFLPDGREADAGLPGDSDQALDPRWARERYAPAWAATFRQLAPSFETFRRGDSTLVVVTYDVSADTAFADPGLVAALVLQRDARTPPVVVRDSGAAPSGVLTAAAAWEPALLALEIRSPAHRAAGRSRARPPAMRETAGAVGPSGLVLFDPIDPLPASLEAALARAHAGALRAGTRIGLYWEVYGLETGEDFATAVTVAPLREGLFHRLAAAVGLAAKTGRVRLEWHEPARPEHAAQSRALLLDLSGLGPGRYRLEVTVSAPGSAPATASRVVTVVRP